MKPVYWSCGDHVLGEKYGYGYWTGPQKDLLCVKPDIKTNGEAELHLSPICKTKKEAKRAFEKKRKETENCT